jgi:hypothetical protein
MKGEERWMETEKIERQTYLRDSKNSNSSNNKTK